MSNTQLTSREAFYLHTLMPSEKQVTGKDPAVQALRKKLFAMSEKLQELYKEVSN